MSSQWIINIIRVIVVLTIQLTLLKRTNLAFGDFNYIHLSIYPYAIALLPYNVPRAGYISIAFLIGIVVDIFYQSLGVHAGACTLIAFLRHYILLYISPRDGYKNPVLSSYYYGVVWFLTYMGLMLFFHQLTLYSLEAFSPVYFREILLRTIFSFLASLFLITIVQLIFNPKT